MKLLFLASWYPEHAASRNGLFIWQHAQAATLLPGAQVVLAAATASEEHTTFTLEQSVKNGVAHWVVRYPTGGSPLVQAWRYFRAWRLLRTTYVHAFGKPSAVLVNVLWRAGLVAWWWKYRLGWKYSILEHWSGYLPNGQGFEGLLQKVLTRLVGRSAEKVAGVSQALVDGMRGHGISSRLMVVPNVIDSQTFHPLNPNPRSHHLLHVSNLAPEKNFDFVLSVWQSWRNIHPDAQLWVAGAIPESRLLAYQQMEGLVFMGFLSPQSLADTYRKAYALLLPSAFETFSIVTAEALACGTPVLASELPALDVWLSTGLVCLPLQTDLWIRSLQSEAVSHPNIDAASVAQLFSPSSVAQQMQQLLTYERS